VTTIPEGISPEAPPRPDRPDRWRAGDAAAAAAGFNTIGGSFGNDTIDGTAGDDAIFAGPGSDLAYGGSGRDAIRGDTGNDRLFGGKQSDILEGEGGDDSLFGGDHDDTVYGGAGANAIHGDSGNDTLSGGSGSDKVYGGDGDDLIFHQGGSPDFIGGDAGYDTLSFGAHGPALTFDLASATLTLLSSADTITGIEAVQGTGGDDTILARGALDFDGHFGDDRLIWLGGSGTYYGGGDFSGSRFNDLIDLGGVTDAVTLDLAAGSARVGSARFVHGAFDSAIGSAIASNHLTAGNTDSTLAGGSAADVLIGGAGNDALFAGAGDDRLHAGGDSFDRLDLGDGDDFARAAGPAGLPQVFGWTSVNGGDGADRIVFAETTGVVRGGTGDDIVDLSRSNATVSGEDGNDVIVVRRADARLTTVTINGGAGYDRVSLYGGDAIVRNVETVTGSFHADRLLIETPVADGVDLGDGNDRIDARDDATIFGGAGDDTALLWREALVYGGDGDDLVSAPQVHGTASIRAFLGNGEDEFFEGASNALHNGSRIRGGGGNDEMALVGNRTITNTLWGDAGNDTLILRGNGALFGGGGDDTIRHDPVRAGVAPDGAARGGDGNDTIRGWTVFGEAGDDVVIGAVMDGGGGADEFTLAPGLVPEFIVMDFDPAADLLTLDYRDFAAYGITSLADLDYIRQSGADTLIKMVVNSSVIRVRFVDLDMSTLTDDILL
jgi:Ca2+-binding RTX toxin-like protein